MLDKKNKSFVIDLMKNILFFITVWRAKVAPYHFV